MKIYSQIFFGVFAFILLVFTCFFCIIAQELWKKRKKLKREWIMSTNDGKNGHRGRIKNEVHNDLVNATLEFLCAIGFTAVMVYNLIDSILKIFE